MTHQDEFDLLCFVLRHADQGEAALASFRDPAAFRYLHTMGYVTQHPASGRFFLTNQGRERLELLRDLLSEQVSQAEQQHQQPQQPVVHIHLSQPVVDRKHDFRITFIGAALDAAFSLLEKPIHFLMDFLKQRFIR